MADFTVVIAAAAALAGPAAPGPAVPAPAGASPGRPTPSVRTEPDVASCERAAAARVVPAGSRLVRVPAAPVVGEMASAD